MHMVLQVVSVMFDHHYQNPDKPVTYNKFSSVHRLIAQSDLFGLPSEQAGKVSTYTVLVTYVASALIQRCSVEQSSLCVFFIL